VAVGASMPERAGRTQPGTQGVGDLDRFRVGLYRCLTRRADALFELADALAHPVAVASVAHLSLAGVHRRGHGSGYAALAAGRVDTEQLKCLLAAHRPTDWPPVFAVDTTTWARNDAECSPGRGFYYHPSRHSAGQPIVAGWSYSLIAGLSWSADSWTAPVDAVRLVPGCDANQVAVRQIQALTARCGTGVSAGIAVPHFVFDGGYDPVTLQLGLAGTSAAILVRLRKDRCFYADPPPVPAGTLGRPRRHGAKLACADPATWPTPDASLTVTDDQYGTVQVTAWSGLHPKTQRHPGHGSRGPRPIARGTLLRVQVGRLPGRRDRAPKTLWLWWAGPAGATPDLDLCWRAYIRRFDIEHTIRFAKQTLGWTTPKIRHPDQADTWTWLVLAAYTQLRLARPLVADHRLPWQPRQPADKLTPGRVRRGFGHLAQRLATPARAPKPSRPGPGRPKGRRSGPAPRHPAIKKTP
jgi:DDE superfamily endonuclease